MSDKGIRCPVCGCTRMPAWRTSRAASMMVRIRQCEQCLTRIKTREIVTEQVVVRR